MKVRLKILFAGLLSLIILNTCNKDEDNDKLPDNIIDFPAIIDDWEWQHTIRLDSGDILYPDEGMVIIYTYTTNDIFYATENDVKGQSYEYYITSETDTFDTETLNKMYLYQSGRRVLDRYFYLSNDTTLIIYDGVDYGFKGTFIKLN